MSRPEHLAVIGLKSGELNDILDGLAKVIVPVHLRFLWRPRLKDAADEMVLETAVNGMAEYLVTFNLRRLQLAARDFGIGVVRPADAWKEIRRRDEKK